MPLLVLLLLSPAWAAPTLARSVWTTADGLPVNSVNDVAIDREGYVWLATFDGLVRFDGVRFTVFDADGTPGLPTNRILSVEEAPDGALWLGTEPGVVVRRDPGSGVMRAWSLAVGDGPAPLSIGRDGTVRIGLSNGYATFDGTDFVTTEVSSPDPGPTRIRALADGPDGALWLGTAHYVGRQDAAGTQWFPIQGVRTLTFGPEGTLWVGTWNTLARFQGDAVVPVDVDGAPWPDGVAAVWPTGPDAAWVSVDSGLYRWAGGHRTLVDPDGAGQAPIRTAVTTDADGHAWSLSRTGVLRDGEVVARATGTDVWTDIAAAPEGGVWVGSGGGGLLHLREAPIETLGEAVAPGLSGIYGLALGRDGSVLAASLRNGLYRIRDAAVQRLGEGSVLTALEDPDGTLWTGFLDRGIARGPDLARIPELPRGNVRLLDRRRDGTLIGSVGGRLFELRNGAWTELLTDPPLPSAPVRVMLETDDALWLGTNGAGLLRIEGSRLTRFGRAEGFPSDAIRALWRSEAGTLWIGTEDRGLLGWVPGAAAPRVISRREGLPNHCVHALLPDGLGSVWGSTNHGLFRVSEAELEAYARGERDTVDVVTFGTDDGMADAEANGGVHRTALQTADGRLWFATQAGVAVVHPDRVQKDDHSARPRVETIRLDGREEQASGTLRIAPSERNLGIDYTALPATSGRKQRFWYRLDEVDAGWVYAGSRRTAWYTGLPVGTHTFHVRTRAPGEADAEEDTLVLTVVPLFHETAGFRALVVVLGIGAVAAFTGSRLAAARRRERVLEERVRSRTADLAAEKELAQTAERTIAAQAARLAEVDRLKTRFFQDLSHELRTPLTLVIGPLEDVRTGRHGAVPPAVEAQVGLAERNARRLFALVNQLLDLVRLDAGALRLDRTPQDLVALVAAVAEVHEPLADRRGVTLEVALPAQPVLVDFDRRELEKVFANLLANALKFTPRGGRVVVTMSVLADHVEVAIADSGPGLSADVRERLFERFHSPGESEVQAGSGIGLSLARDLTERHDGRIRVDSVEGKGSTFTVELPRSRAEVVATTEAFVPTPPTPSIEPAADEADVDADDRTTVLVADDHAEVRAWIRSHLAPRYRVIEAEDGREAFALARRTLPDLVVSDVMMPKLDGLGLVRALRADPELDAVAILILTAKGSDASRIEGFERGADAWLTKPFSSAVLVAQVDGLLAQRRRLRERRPPPPEPTDDTLSADERYLRRVRAAIEANLHDPTFGVQELADAIAQDRAHLFRRMKELTGEPPSTLLRTARLERAATLLSRRAGTVSEIAYAVGFNAISHFSKAFRDHHGVPPTAWAAEGRGAAPPSPPTSPGREKPVR